MSATRTRKIRKVIDATYKVELAREVSRVVELRQTTEVYLKAPSLALAKEAATRLDRELDDHEWRDDDTSRVASNDRVVRDPFPDRVYQVDSGPNKMQAASLRNLEPMSACEILGLIGEDED